MTASSSEIKQVTFGSSNSNPTTDVIGPCSKDTENVFSNAVAFLNDTQIHGIWTNSEKLSSFFSHTKQTFLSTRDFLQKTVNSTQFEIPKIAREVDKALEKRKDNFPAEEAELRSADSRWTEDKAEVSEVFTEGKLILLLELQPGPVAGRPGPARLYHPGSRPDTLSSDFEVSEDSFF